MQIVLQHNRSGALEIANLPPPRLAPDGVLVRTAFSLISAGTERNTRELAQKSLIGKALARPDQVRQVIDIAKREGIGAAREKVAARLDVERPLGYSSAGVVADVGSRVSKHIVVGQRVACAGGGYANHAEIVYVPQNLCVPVPDGVSLDSAAFATVGAIAMQGVRQADVRVGERVAVIGLGLVGQLTVQILRAAGCGVIGFDLNPERCRLAVEFGADRAEPPGSDAEQIVRDWTPFGVDAVIIAAATSSSEPIQLAADICRDRGRVVVVGSVGMDISREPFYRKELDLRLSRSYGPGRYDSAYEERGIDYPLGYVRWTEGRNIEAFLDLLGRGAVNVSRLITHRFPLNQATDAYAVVEGHSDRLALGVLFTYPVNQPEVAPPTYALVEQQPTTSALPGIGLIGAGKFATGVLLPALRSVGPDKVRLRGVASATGISARTTGQRYGFAFCTSDGDEVIDDASTDAVIIATRHDQHASLVIRALEAGKTVYVEKPLALTLEEIRDIVAAQHRTNRPVLVGFNRRYSAVTHAVREHFATCREPLALIARVNAGALAPDHWTRDPFEGGGRIRGEACHFVDLLQFLADSIPIDVDARALTAGSRGEPENIVATIRFANGSVGTLAYLANGDSALPKEWIEVIGGGRAATIEDFRHAVLYRDGKQRKVRANGQDKGHRNEMAAFVELLRGGGASPLPFKTAILSTLATFAILESAATGQRVPVDLSAIGAEQFANA